MWHIAFKQLKNISAIFKRQNPQSSEGLHTCFFGWGKGLYMLWIRVWVEEVLILSVLVSFSIIKTWHLNSVVSFLYLMYLLSCPLLCWCWLCPVCSPLLKVCILSLTVNICRGRELTGAQRDSSINPVSNYGRMHLHRRILGHLSAVYCIAFDRTGLRIFTVRRNLTLVQLKLLHITF